MDGIVNTAEGRMLPMSDDDRREAEEMIATGMAMPEGQIEEPATKPERLAGVTDEQIQRYIEDHEKWPGGGSRKSADLLGMQEQLEDVNQRFLSVGRALGIASTIAVTAQFDAMRMRDENDELRTRQKRMAVGQIVLFALVGVAIALRFF